MYKGKVAVGEDRGKAKRPSDFTRGKPEGCFGWGVADYLPRRPPTAFFAASFTFSLAF